ncbi:MAG TPA: hypothetical protein VGM87_03080 [Roseomonas sp.]|jgi:hypothetical protein
MADTTIRWPRPPYRLSSLVGATARVMQACALFLALAGLSLLLSGVDGLLLPDPFDADKPFFARAWPRAMLMAIGIGLMVFARMAWRQAGMRHAVASGGPATGRIIEVDLLSGRARGRGPGVAWGYSFSLGARRLWHRELRANTVLYLDDLQTRGAALLTSDEAVTLLMPGLAPILPEPAALAAAQADIARRVAIVTIRPGHRLRALEARTPAGPQRDFVRLYREAAEAGGRRRARLIWQRQEAADKLDWAMADQLLQECRRHAGP